MRIVNAKPLESDSLMGNQVDVEFIDSEAYPSRKIRFGIYCWNLSSPTDLLAPNGVELSQSGTTDMLHQSRPFRLHYKIQFCSTSITKNTLLFAVVSALRTPVKKSFLESRARCESMQDSHKAIIHIPRMGRRCLVSLLRYRVLPIGSTPNFFPSPELLGVSKLRDSELSGVDCIG